MRRSFSILMFPTVARAKDQCQLARNETQVWCRSVSREKKAIFSDVRTAFEFFAYLFFVASWCSLITGLPFNMNSFSTSCFHFFPAICMYTNLIWTWTRISHTNFTTFSFFLLKFSRNELSRRQSAEILLNTRDWVLTEYFEARLAKNLVSNDKN